MSIIFGHNNFVIKRIYPKELGMHDNPQMQGSEIQLLQKYAHLYFIPLFPIGQQWVLEKDGKKYELTNDMRMIMQRNYPSRVHIGAFALPIIAILGIIGFTIYEKVSNYQQEIKYAADLEINGNLLSKKLDSIGNDHTAIISFSNQSNSIEQTYSVVETKGNQLLLKKIDDEINNRDHNLPSSIAYFLISKENNDTSNTIWVNKNDLKKNIAFKDPFKPTNIKGLENNALTVADIDIIRDAYFKEETPEDAVTPMYREYVNYGNNAVIDSIVPLSASEDWKLSKTKIVNFKERFAIKTESTGSATMYYHTVPDNKIHKVKISDHQVLNHKDNPEVYY